MCPAWRYVAYAEDMFMRVQINRLPLQPYVVINVLESTRGFP
jgi:hypothetical protein